MAQLHSARPSPRTSGLPDESLPDNTIEQTIGGQLVVLPRPNAPHVEAESILGALLIRSFQIGDGGPGGWVILHEPEIAFSSDRLVPDLAGWREERFLSPRRGPYTVAPDWVCEILSPSSIQTDRVRKLPVYSAHGVGHVWLLDPQALTLEVLRRERRSWLLAGAWSGADIVHAEPFAEVALDLSRLWGNLWRQEPPKVSYVSEPQVRYGV